MEHWSGVNGAPPMQDPITTNRSHAGRVRIVVPAYNEAARFDLKVLDEYLERETRVDFVLVNDGSRDQTLELLEQQAAKWPTRISVVDLQPNRGKAEAVRQGMLAALAQQDSVYVGFWDADWATPLDTLEDFIRHLDNDSKVEFVMGSRVRLLGRHIKRKTSRHYVGRIAATLASMVLGLAVYDTQCGAKLLRVGSDTRRLFAEPFGSRWVFDVELIARYLERCPAGEGIYELPLEQWREVGDSKVRPHDAIGAFWDILGIYRRYRMHKRR